MTSLAGAFRVRAPAVTARARAAASACVVGIVLLAAAGPSLAGSPVNTGYFGGVAIMGYDPVAYFTEGRPVKGSEELAYEWLGTPWLFASERHREMFIADPVRYAPQYGGHCSLGTAFGETTMNIDPEAWRIIDGKLYLNYDSTSIAELDTPAGPELIEKADANWAEIRPRLEAVGAQ